MLLKNLILKEAFMEETLEVSLLYKKDSTVYHGAFDAEGNLHIQVGQTFSQVFSKEEAKDLSQSAYWLAMEPEYEELTYSDATPELLQDKLWFKDQELYYLYEQRFNDEITDDFTVYQDNFDYKTEFENYLSKQNIDWD